MKYTKNELMGSAVAQLSLYAVYLLSSEGDVMSWNRGAREIKGWDGRDITGLNFSVFYDEDEQAAGVPAANLAAAREHGWYRGEGMRLRKDGSLFRAAVEIEYLSPAGTEQPAFIKTVRDVSGYHQEKMALRITQQLIVRRDAELSEAGRMLDDIFSHAPCALILCDALTGRILRVNPTAIRLPWLKETVLRGSVTGPLPSGVHPELYAVFRRGLSLLSGEGFSDVLLSGQSESALALRIAAEKLVAGNDARETVLFTALDVTAEHRAALKSAHEAIHDPLTGLLNRRGLMPELEKLIRCRVPFAVMVSDIDRFKMVNDVLGHQAGDALLAGVTARMCGTLRDEDILARTGGDEFVSILPGISSGDAAGEIAGRLVSAMREPFSLNGRQILSGCSTGICLFPGGAEDGEGLLSAADIALYAAKAAGRSGWAHYSDDLALTTTGRFSLENDLRGALANGELQLFYQPVVDGVTESVVSYEALLRWYHPVRGAVSPEIFIPLAERAGLIYDIGAFALMRACREAAGWPDKERVAVNLSPLQFRDPHLFSTVKSALQQSGLAPGRLELEVTESALIENTGDSVRVLRAFRELGIHVVLDDFGTGFSSLGHLRQNLFSRIKIDRSFISDLNSDARAAAIVGSVLSLCHQLGLEVTAEGVETSEQAGWLKHNGCNLLQGFLYGRPGPHIKRKER